MSEQWSPAVETVANRVSVEIAQALTEISDPAARDLAASMVRIGYDLGVSYGRLEAAREQASRTLRFLRDELAEPVNGAAEPKAYAHEPECNTVHDGPAACPPPAEPECPCRDHVAARADVETTAIAEAVLSETSEPYVSVSVSANDADELAKLLRKLIREKGAKSFGLAAAP